MKLIVELDGIILNIKPPYWRAYRDAVADVGLAPTDEATFWRLLRVGADFGQMIRGAKPRQVEAFQIVFEGHKEKDANVALATAHELARDVLAQLSALGEISAATLGTNILARRELLSSFSALLNPSIEQLNQLTDVGAEQLRALARGHDKCVVILSSERFARAADKAELPSVGIAGGAFLARRLSTCGVRVVFPDLNAFACSFKSQDAKLVEMGLVLPLSAKMMDRGLRRQVDRGADQIERRTQRMRRRGQRGD